MKRIISILFLTCFLSFQKEKVVIPDKIVVLINQVPWERPIANTIETFWQDKEHFDTIQIVGKTILNHVNGVLSKLVKEDNFSEISYESCIITNGKTRFAKVWRRININKVNKLSSN